MKKFTCSVRFGLLAHSGCSIKVDETGIYIKQLFFNILTIPFSDVRKIIILKNGVNIFKNNMIKIEYGKIGAIKNEIVDIRIPNRKSFIKHILQFSQEWEIEEKDNYIRENNSGVTYVK